MDDTNLKDETVIEGQIEESSSPSNSDAPLSKAELVVSLTNLINANLSEIDNLGKEMSKHKEMIDSVLSNDMTYKEHLEKAKEAARIKSNTKKEIFSRPSVKHIVEKLAELKENLRDTREELSNYIQEYAQASGQNYFEAEDGSIQEIFYIAKLRKKQV